MTTRTDASPVTAVFQLRAAPELLQKVKDIAAKNNMSANRYLVDAIKARIALEKEQEWKSGFEAMGRDPDMDVEYMLPAASEVMLGR